MARRSRLCWPSVIEAPVAGLDAAGFGLAQPNSLDPCPGCGCLMGDHLAALPGHVAAIDLRNCTGWIECPRCDTSCGVLSMALPLR